MPVLPEVNSGVAGLGHLEPCANALTRKVVLHAVVSLALEEVILVQLVCRCACTPHVSPAPLCSKFANSGQTCQRLREPERRTRQGEVTVLKLPSANISITVHPCLLLSQRAI